MPRSKTRKPKVKTDVTRRMATRRHVNPLQSKAPVGLDRHNRPDVRPPKFPGRLGGR